MAGLEQICAGRRPELNKSGEGCRVYMMYSSQDVQFTGTWLLFIHSITFGKMSTHICFLVCQRCEETNAFPSLSPQEGNIELQLKQAGFAKCRCAVY